MEPDFALFAAVVDAGSLSAAARRLALSPAMVSKRIARLEARLGAHLLHRTTRRLSLTTAGARFHADVVQILDLARAAEARVAGGRSAPHGPLTVSAPTSFGRLHVAPLLPAFIDAYPGVALRLDLSDGYADLPTERIDVAVRIASAVPETLTATRLAPNRRLLCASPAYLDCHGTAATLDALAQHHLLAADGQWPWRLTDGRRVVAVEGTSHVRTNSSEIVRELALAGAGIALRSLWDVSAELAAGRLVRVLPGWEGPPELAVYAVTPRNAHPLPAATAFVAFLAAQFDPAPWDS